VTFEGVMFVTVDTPVFWTVYVRK